MGRIRQSRKVDSRIQGNTGEGKRSLQRFRELQGIGNSSGTVENKQD